MNHEKLDRLYREADGVHNKLFAEQRSNVLLVAGNHFNRRGSKFWNRVRDTKNLSRKEKLRLTKNHLQRITKTYQNNISSYAPGVGIRPKNDNEMKDRKAAELHDSVWQHFKKKSGYNKIKRKLIADYIDIGEGWVKSFWDFNKGDFLGYEPVLNEWGEPELDEEGKPKGTPIFTGALVFERILGFNVLTDPEARSYEECKWVCYRKMVSTEDLKARYANDQERLAYIDKSAETTYKLFDGQNGTYSDSKGLTMIREFYFKPTEEMPNGMYYITTEHGVLHEGELPLGEFPIKYVGFDELPTSARSVSIIKQLRPVQAEISRASSKVAEHQVTLGDDKIITQNGVTISPGGTAHGIKHVKVNGPAPTILPGRSGEQYLGYIQAQIGELYQISNLQEEIEKAPANLDPYTLLFRSIKDKKKFTLYTDKWMEFEFELVECALRMIKAYISEEAIVPLVGKPEMVNIPEFKATDDLSYQIDLEEQSEDVETKMGRQLSLNQILQYAGSSMNPDDLGKLIKAMPYVSKEEAFGDLTIDYENATNDILRLDRGQFTPASPDDNHPYMLKRLRHRMKQADFEFMDPQKQQMYQMRVQQHNQFNLQQMQEAERAKAGFIPSGGALVPVDMYVPDPEDPSKQKKLRLPYESLDWLQNKLRDQGTTEMALARMEMVDQARLGQMMQMQGGIPQGPTIPAEVIGQS